MATRARSVYLPAVARARVVHRRSVTILGELERTFNRAVIDLQPQGIGAPSVASALVRMGRGEPRAIAAEAVVARDKARSFRAAIAEYTDNEINLDSNCWHEARLLLREHEGALRQSLGLQPAPTFLEAFDIDIFGMTVTASPSKIRDWWAYRRKMSRISFLGEFAKGSADTRIDDSRYFRRLTSLACRSGQ